MKIYTAIHQAVIERGSNTTQQEEHSATKLTDTGIAPSHLTDVVESCLVKEDLLQDECGHGLAELRAGFHDAQA